MSFITAVFSIVILAGVYTGSFSNLVITVILVVNVLVLIVLAFVFSGKINRL